MVLEVDQCRRPPPFLAPTPTPRPPSPQPLSPQVRLQGCTRVVCKLQAGRLQIASVSSANCKGVVCNLQGGCFSDNFCFQIQIFSFFFSFYFLCKLQGFLCKLQACPLQIANVPCFLLKHSPVFHASPIQELPRAGRGGQGSAVAAEGWQSCQGLLKAARGCQGLPRVAGDATGWQGFPRVVSDVPHHDGHTYQSLASLRLSAAVRKRKERKQP